MRRSIALAALGAVATLLPLLFALAEDEGGRRIVLADIQLTGGLEETAPKAGVEVTAQFARKLARRFAVVGGDELRGVLEERSLRMADLFNSAESCTAVAKDLRAQKVLLGILSPSPEGVLVTVRVLDVAEGAFGRWDSKTVQSVAGIPPEVHLLLERAGLLSSELETDVAYFGELSAAEKEQLCERKLAAAEEGEELDREHYDWFTARGQSTWAKRWCDTVLARDPDRRWANEAAGRRDLREVYRRIPKDPLLGKYPHEAGERLAVFRKNVATWWGTIDEYEAAEGLVAQILEHLERLKTDRDYLDLCTVERSARVHPRFNKYRFLVGAAPPYVVLAQHEDTDPPMQQAEETLKRAKALLGEVYDEFHRSLGRNLKLPRLSEFEDRDLRFLKVFVFSGRQDFEEYLGDDDIRGGDLTLGYDYRASDRWIVAHAERAPEAQSGFGELEERLLSGGAQQLLHVYRKILTEREREKEVSWFDEDLKCRLFSFALGFGSLLGSTEYSKKGKRVWMAPNPRHLTLIRKFKKEERPVWTAEELARFESRNSMLNSAARLGGFERVEEFEALFAAQSWAFCHYLWWYGGGKLRRKLIRYIERDLSGHSGSDEFCKSLWGKKKPNWAAVESEYRSHVNRLLAKSGK